jgi:hypothetical protein
VRLFWLTWPCNFVTDKEVDLEAILDSIEPMEEKLSELEEELSSKVFLRLQSLTRQVNDISNEYFKKKRPFIVKRNAALSKIPNFWITCVGV